MRSNLPSHIDPQHPVVLQEYAVYTPPIDAMIEKIAGWIDQQKPGGYVYGASRFGKSRGVKYYIRAVLEERFQRTIPLVVWIRPPDIHTSEAFFWHELLLAAQFHFANPKKVGKRSENQYLFVQRLITIARSARSNYVVLLIDEAQDLTFKEWKWLAGLQNKLDWQGFRLSVFSIGTHQLGYRHELMGISENVHVAARFMVAHAPFHGLSSEDELRYVLKGYDTESEWPSGSHISFLKYFAPDWFERGERLEECATSIWKALNELCPVEPSKKQKQLEFPMQHVAEAVERALFRLANGESWEEVTSYGSWLQMIAQTEFSDFMRYVSRPRQ